jgi:hypothetical protein
MFVIGLVIESALSAAAIDCALLQPGLFSLLFLHVNTEATPEGFIGRGRQPTLRLR